MGVTVFEVNGLPDHVHVVTTLPPKIAAAELIGQMKGFSAYMVNEKRIAQERFQWQAEYGAFSFDEKRLPFVIDYVRRQEAIHATGKTIRTLERDTEVSGSELHESLDLYDFDALAADWYREMKNLDAKSGGPDAPRTLDGGPGLKPRARRRSP
jgi:hypothetical protein